MPSKARVLPLMPDPVRRYYERERPIEWRPVELDRYLGKRIADGRFHALVGDQAGQGPRALRGVGCEDEDGLPRVHEIGHEPGIVGLDGVLDALYSRRYTPVMWEGKPVAVNYVFNIRLVMPK